MLINKIVVFDKSEHSDKGFKYFIGYKEDDIIRPMYYIASNKWIQKIVW